MYGWDVVFRWSTPRVSIEVSLEPYKPTIFIGFNNTLKSITARMIIASLCQQGLVDEEWSIPRRNWQRYLETVLTRLSGSSESVASIIEVGEAIKEKKLSYILLEDSRIALRKYLEVQDCYQSIFEGVEDINTTGNFGEVHRGSTE